MTDSQQKQQQDVLTIAHRDYAKKLNLHAFFKLSDHAIGENLVQDTFMKTWKYLAKGGKIEIMKSFLYQILNNLIVDEYRKHKTSSLDILIESGFEPADEDDSERAFNIADGSAALLLINRLPIAYQKVMNMRYAQSLSLKEISVLTGQTQNATAVRLHRGLEKLKVLYARPL